jgi:hypothetical protein
LKSRQDTKRGCRGTIINILQVLSNRLILIGAKEYVSVGAEITSTEIIKLLSEIPSRQTGKQLTFRGINNDIK